MKAYLSLPISGYNLDERKEYARRTSEILTFDNASEGVTVITPFDICKETDKPYEYYMGRDIEALLQCDIVYFCKGWHNSRGCCLEMEAAKIYGKEIRFA